MNNNMFITSQGLKKVSKKLISESSFSRDLVKIVGNPIIVEGIASSFSEDNYVMIDKLDLEDSNFISIDFKGTFTAEIGDECCMWELKGYNAPVIIEACILNGNLYIKKGEEYLGEHPLYIENNDRLSTKISIGPNGYECLVFVNNRSFEYSGSFDNEIVPQLFDTCNIGGTSNYWQGTVNLNLFRIYKNDEVYFSSAINNEFKFTEILLSDGSVPLTDSSFTILNHVVRCPVYEITRNGNNLLLKVTVDSEISINVEEIGLYSEGRDGRQLFSLIQGLKINKSSSVGYSLIIHVNLDLNVVNTSILPEIIVKETKSSKNRDFLRIQRDYLYIVTLLERMIKINALGINGYKTKDNFIHPYPPVSYSVEGTTLNPIGLDIEPKSMIEVKPVGVGYNRAQQCYRLQKSIKEWEEGYNTSWVYSNLKEKFTLKTLNYADYSKLTLEGSVLLEGDELSSFSSSSYGVCKGISDRMDTFKLGVSFYAYSTTSGTVLCVSNESIEQPLELQVINGRLVMTLGKQDSIEVEGYVEGYVIPSNILYRTSQSIQDGQNMYYAWSYLGKDTSIDDSVKGLYTIYTKGSYNVTETSELYMINDDSGEIVKCENLSVTSIHSGILKQIDVSSVATNNLYTIEVEYDGSKYSIETRSNNGSTIYQEFYSGYPIGNCKDLLLGVTKDKYGTVKTPLDGKVYLNNTYLETQGTETKFINSKIVNETKLSDFYHIPESNYNLFRVRNLETNKGEFDILYNDGMITSNRLNIDLNNSKEFTLGTKVFFKELGEGKKTILAYINKATGSRRFKLELIPNPDKSSKLVFTMFSSGEVRLEKSFNELETAELVTNSCLLTITKEGDNYCLFKNKKLLSKGIAVVPSSRGEFYLTNYDLGEVVQENIISDIFTLSKAASDEDMYYICNALDSNF